ncbi:MAG TPA: hypothetical protein VGE41_03445 [Verrucomicrobiae bacterium]|jgi:hypothetical protein
MKRMQVVATAIFAGAVALNNPFEKMKSTLSVPGFSQRIKPTLE